MMMFKRKGKVVKSRSRYKRELGKTVIEIQVRTVKQLFDARDPAPFKDRDLDDRAAEYILSSAKEFSHSTPLKMVIHLLEEINEENRNDLMGDALKESIHEYFRYEADLSRGRRKQVLKSGQYALILGVVILVLFLSLAGAIGRGSEFPLQSILREGLVISGWVAMWRPIDLLLFDWWPHATHERLCKKLSRTEIEIRLS